MSDSGEREDDSGELDPGHAELTPEQQALLEEERLELERRYFTVTKSWHAALLFALPLLVAYEIGVMICGSEINAAAYTLKAPISWLQENPTEIFGLDVLALVNGALTLAILLAAWKVIRLGALIWRNVLGVFFESSLYAMLLGPLALAPITGEFHLTQPALNLHDFPLKLFISAGAGFYEEAFFRLLILWAIFYLAKEAFKLKPFTAGALALVVSGAAFSAAHFLIGTEEADLGAFIYRLTAGMFLGLIFLLRGFGVAAWTHALFDFYILCFTAE